MSNSPVALVTGSARRLGATIVRTLHSQGDDVVIHYRDSRKEALALCEQCNAIRPHSAITLQADFAKIDALKKLIDDAYNPWQRLDVLVNNASEYFPTSVGSTTKQEWDDLMISNLQAPYFLVQSAIPYLQKTRGCIINLSDINSFRPLKTHIPYCAAKAGLNSMTEALAKALGPDIRVNAVAPGPIPWPEDLDEKSIQAIIEHSVLKRQGTADDIANAVLFLIQQPHITGEILKVDGGRGLQGIADSM